MSSDYERLTLVPRLQELCLDLICDYLIAIYNSCSSSYPALALTDEASRNVLFHGSDEFLNCNINRELMTLTSQKGLTMPLLQLLVHRNMPINNVDFKLSYKLREDDMKILTQQLQKHRINTFKIEFFEDSNQLDVNEVLKWLNPQSLKKLNLLKLCRFRSEIKMDTLLKIDNLHLTDLNISYCSLTQEIFHRICYYFINLKYLDISGTLVTDLTPITNLNTKLISLSLSNMEKFDVSSAISALKQMRELRHLYLTDRNIDEPFMSATKGTSALTLQLLQENEILPKLTILDISGCQQKIDEEDLLKFLVNHDIQILGLVVFDICINLESFLSEYKLYGFCDKFATLYDHDGLLFGLKFYKENYWQLPDILFGIRELGIDEASESLIAATFENLQYQKFMSTMNYALHYKATGYDLVIYGRQTFLIHFFNDLLPSGFYENSDNFFTQAISLYIYYFSIERYPLYFIAVLKAIFESLDNPNRTKIIYKNRMNLMHCVINYLEKKKFRKGSPDIDATYFCVKFIHFLVTDYDVLIYKLNNYQYLIKGLNLLLKKCCNYWHDFSHRYHEKLYDSMKYILEILKITLLADEGARIELNKHMDANVILGLHKYFTAEEKKIFLELIYMMNFKYFSSGTRIFDPNFQLRTWVSEVMAEEFPLTCMIYYIIAFQARHFVQIIHGQSRQMFEYNISKILEMSLHMWKISNPFINPRIIPLEDLLELCQDNYSPTFQLWGLKMLLHWLTTNCIAINETNSITSMIQSLEILLHPFDPLRIVIEEISFKIEQLNGGAALYQIIN